LQVSMKTETSFSMVMNAARHQTQHPTALELALAQEDTEAKPEAQALLQTRKFTASTDQITVATSLLEGFAKVLKSGPLKSVSQRLKKNLDISLLQRLWKQLQNLQNTGKSGEKEKQAEKWCHYFQENQEGVAPMQEARDRVKELKGEQESLIQASSALVKDPTSAGVTLPPMKKEVAGDTQAVNSLLQRNREEFKHTSASLASAKKRLDDAVSSASAKTALVPLYDALENVKTQSSALHTEVEDFVGIILEKRAKATTAQTALLQTFSKEKAAEAAAKESEQKQTETWLGAQEKKVGQITKSCSKILSQRDVREQREKMEINAIRSALVVLNISPQK